MAKYEVYIGIDPGVDTGFAVWIPEHKRLEQVDSLAIHKAMSTVLNWHLTGGVTIFVRIEDARQRTWIPYSKNEKGERGRAAGAGSVKRDCQIWQDFLTDHRIPFELVPPKNNKTKYSAEIFNRLTGWNQRSNNHGRDAAMLVFGK